MTASGVNVLQGELPLVQRTPMISERYCVDERRGRISRVVMIAGREKRSSVTLLPAEHGPLDAAELFDWCWLRAKRRPRGGRGTPLRIADLFSGCGQMTVGALEAARAVGVRAEPVLALDMDAAAVSVFKKNFHQAHILQDDIRSHLDADLGAAATISEKTLQRRVGEIDLLLGGPPCQGHSDLNNHTRRTDPRNALALRMLRFAELFEPKHVVLENVRGIVHDKNAVFDRLERGLEELGYAVRSGVLRAEKLGVAQSRHRRFLVATHRGASVLSQIFEPAIIAPRDFRWACGDLNADGPAGSLDAAPTPSAANRKRINYLCENDYHDLPDSERPPCHAHGNHSYKSIYGRLHWDRPAQTITTGFRCMGQGRYVHPDRRAARTITPHEAARLQFIPDFFDFADVAPTALARLIGNAVPPKLTYHIVRHLLAAEAALEG